MKNPWQYNRPMQQQTLQMYRFKISAAPAQQAPKTSSAMATPVTCKLDYLFGCLQTLHIHRTRRHRAVQSKNLRSFPFRAKSHKKIEQFVQITNACGLEDGRNHIHSNGVLSFWVMGTAAQWQDAGYLPSCSCKKCHCLALLHRLEGTGCYVICGMACLVGGDNNSSIWQRIRNMRRIPQLPVAPPFWEEFQHLVVD